MATLFLFIARSFSKLSSFSVLLLFLFSFSSFTSTEAYDPLDPKGNITIKWDIMSWTADGYVAVVTIYNFQQYRHIQAPGWTLGWKWAKKEVIWSIMGGQTTEQGDCSKFNGNIQHCYPATAASSFQVSVGQAETTNKMVRVPRNFTLKAPGPSYTCGPAKIVKPSRLVSADKRRVTQALSNPKAPHIASVVPGKNNLAPLVQCTSHVCLVRIHWHVKLNYKYRRVKVTITNFNYNMNYTRWNLVVQHPNFNNLTQIFSFNYKSLTPYTVINDTAMLWGVKFYNNLLSQAGPLGNVQSELLFRKDKEAFTFDKGWAFPRRIYFNGDNCVMPTPSSYPWLPNASSHRLVSAQCTWSVDDSRGCNCIFIRIRMTSYRFLCCKILTELVLLENAGREAPGCVAVRASECAVVYL
ncbi:COBRA-like protein 1 [Hibiscus syriacus]|uniref:COBRA-like protein n=1 Tax=Hibiscus syriacus TaxID=106335 RepID=A0A6A3AC69_HIBSY|nr:COBRA-like protein 1 [Hibiscus syriacus]